jgi:hypothetical protein
MIIDIKTKKDSINGKDNEHVIKMNGIFSEKLGLKPSPKLNISNVNKDGENNIAIVEDKDNTCNNKQDSFVQNFQSLLHKNGNKNLIRRESNDSKTKVMIGLNKTEYAIIL